MSAGSLSQFQDPMVVAQLHGLYALNPPEFVRTLLQGRVALDAGRRAVGIVQPVAVAHREDPAPPDRTVLVTVAPDADPTTFSLFIERPGANMIGWPGKNAMGTIFVGRIPLAAGAGTCCIVAHQEPLRAGRAELPRPSNAELRQMRGWVVGGVLVMTIVGELSDGAITLIDLRADPSVVASIDSALGR